METIRGNTIVGKYRNCLILYDSQFWYKNVFKNLVKEWTFYSFWCNEELFTFLKIPKYEGRIFTVFYRVYWVWGHIMHSAS